MMMFIYYLIFMVPLILIKRLNCLYFLYQFNFLILIFIFLFKPMLSYYSLISYQFGIDYFSYGLILLSILIVSLMVLASLNFKSTFFSNLFLLMCLSLCLILVFIFSSLNMIIMYLFFEFSLIPLMIMIFGWGYQPERLISGLYLFFYTLFASLPLFLILIYFYMEGNSLFFNMNYNCPLLFVFHFCLVFAFLVKLPMFMVHFWLPKAHVQAPVSGSMILAGLLLKIGGYGIIRFMYVFEQNFMKYSYIWFSFSLVGGILVSLICLIQADVQVFSCMFMGILTMTKWGVVGAYFLMISHGLCSSGLFCLANISYERLLSRSFYLNKGLLVFMPSMSAMWFIFSSFNMGCPPSLNFLSEILILNSMLSFWSYSSFYFLFISFFSACFSVFLFSFTQHGMFNHLYSFCLGFVREYLLLMIHLIPLFFIVMGLSYFL
nr:NADH dehydrogenase subunit 4 [Thaia sp. 1 NZ-2023b]